ncbi:transposase [Streptomyces chiangmaiensis]
MTFGTLQGPAKGVWFHGYVILDIYSRYVVGHTVEAAESAARAEELIREAIDRNGIVPHTVHADRGTSMTSKQVSQMLLDLGVTRSHSRPRVSNDNPFSESQFRTTKYQPDYPERFGSLTHAREWMEAFVSHYNHVHRHSGIGYHPRQRPLRHRRTGPRATGGHSHHRLRAAPRALQPPPRATEDPPAGVDQRPRPTARTTATQFIAAHSFHLT